MEPFDDMKVFKNLIHPLSYLFSVGMGGMVGSWVQNILFVILNAKFIDSFTQKSIDLQGEGLNYPPLLLIEFFWKNVIR